MVSSNWISDDNASDSNGNVLVAEIFCNYDTTAFDPNCNDSDDNSINDKTATNEEECQNFINKNEATIFDLVKSVKDYANNLRLTLKYNFKTVYFNMVEPFILYVQEILLKLEPTTYKRNLITSANPCTTTLTRTSSAMTMGNTFNK